ncbi:MAG: chloride channel protein [Flavobacteriales bacterium]|nr:chloride channel protein [Flavobacteriales bacterium]HPF89706.1 chloride channel protein [Flavobacteriales bacterium]
MEEQDHHSIPIRIQKYVWSRLERVRQFVWNSQAKNFVLLALPYQISAILTALIAVGYTKLFQKAHQWNHDLLAEKPLMVLLTAPIAFVTSWWLVRYFSPMSGGSGIPQLMAAVEVAKDEERNDGSWRFLNVRIILVKIASSIALAFGGGSIGREGPTLQLAGSVYRTVHKLLPPFWPKVSRKVMMITGGAAGLSAAFNTPLGGIVFAIEELTRTHIAKFRTAVLSSVILSGMTAQWILGPYLLYGYPKVATVGPSFMYKLLAISAVCGLLGAASCKVLLVLDKIRRSMKRWLPQFLFVLLLAFTFAGLVLTFGQVTLGSGDRLLDEYLFASQPTPHWKDAFGRILGSVVSMGAGGAGGVFAPALSSGAAIGGLFGHWFGEDRGELNMMILGGMCAFLTGVTRSPFTSAILVLEMTDRHSVIFQLMYASMIASVVAHTLDKKSYYERMKNRLLDSVPGLRKHDPDPEESE